MIIEMDISGGGSINLGNPDDIQSKQVNANSTQTFTAAQAPKYILAASGHATAPGFADIVVWQNGQSYGTYVANTTNTDPFSTSWNVSVSVSGTTITVTNTRGSAIYTKLFIYY